MSVCQGHSGGVASTFVNTGAGGLAGDSEKQLYSSPGWQRDFVPVPASDSTANEQPTRVVEAQGWIQNSNGDVVLTAEANPVSPYADVSASTCHAEPNLKKNPEVRTHSAESIRGGF
ncbi:hypothetical protein [Nostoc commune]|uniref:hypothetical protein n=1 Tax=Nostoc commune TaxID=1178 RepID=UPI0018C6F185|nr:hypothetical protein [Nostoc commune]MBG1262652.1 hypothetical protein [Nostoc commune BAE]